MHTNLAHAAPRPSRTLMIVALIVGAVPLLIWPFILIANVMSFAAESRPGTPFVQTLVSNLFLWGATLYPLAYLGAGITSIVMASSGRPASANHFAVLPLVYLLLMVLLFVSWFAVS